MGSCGGALGNPRAPRGTPDLNGPFPWAWGEHGPAALIVRVIDWTTHFAKGRPERSLAGVVLDSESLRRHRHRHRAERTDRVHITATSDEARSDEDMPHLVEFLDVTARTLGWCAERPAKWRALFLTVRGESGSIGAVLASAPPLQRVDPPDLTCLGGCRGKEGGLTARLPLSRG